MISPFWIGKLESHKVLNFGDKNAIGKHYPNWALFKLLEKS
jgi:hypothetical protein